ncbi:FAD-dependent oxidoreductase [Pseudonocardia acaciae]|uniref:FAD-dependent oxidoreductase n=1 Tax=Pseudonocardia acaciae TaxID=551276 RepID=UPI000490B90E|nr:FAD-dependent oxidoreductase [Pseudonocardia acaciae]
MSRRVVVVGNGMVGARFIEAVRRRDPDAVRARVAVFGAERRAAYNRVLLSSVLAGGLSADQVRLHDPGWASEHRVELRTGVRVTEIDRAARRVLCDDGASEPYDELVLATGSRAWMPPTEGLVTKDGRPAEGVAAFRDLDDCARILELARPGGRVAVLGGGLLGLEAARGLVGRGVRVSVLHPVEHLMERQLDSGAGAVLAAALGRLGVDVRLGVLAKRWTPGEGLECDDGGRLAVDAVVVAAGVRPEDGLAAAAGIAVDGGVLVDDRMTSSDDRVHAIGDCARHPGTVSGLVQPGFEQAEVLADLLIGADPAARYRGSPLVTRLKARDIDLATAGDGLAEDPGDGSVEVLRLQDARRGRYAKLVLRGDRLVGAIMLGTPDAAASMIQLYDSGRPAPSDRLALLLGRALPPEGAAAPSPAHLPAASVICRCNTVTKSKLVTAFRAGAADLDGLVRATRASTGCGGCRDAVAGVHAWLTAAEGTAS